MYATNTTVRVAELKKKPKYLISFITCKFIMANFAIWLNCGDPSIILKFSLWILQPFLKVWIFSNQLYFHLVINNYHALDRTVAFQLNRQNMLLLQRPLTHFWTSPLSWLANLMKVSFQGLLILYRNIQGLGWKPCFVKMNWYNFMYFL